jgi:hemerythrin
MITWKDEYTMGVEHIDEQHQKLFEIAGRIYNLLKHEMYADKYDKILELIEELKEYTLFHFKSEEEYMMSIGYRKFLTHKVDHDDFIEKVSHVDLAAMDENQDEYIMEILQFVVDWIDQHILEKDKLIVAS